MFNAPNRKRQNESECVALERMRVVYLLQASASVSNEKRLIFQRKRERERKIHKGRNLSISPRCLIVGQLFKLVQAETAELHIVSRFDEYSSTPRPPTNTITGPMLNIKSCIVPAFSSVLRENRAEANGARRASRAVRL
ncbi:hypothetical protein EVAR_96262_1 [Eumeta japonica]|uniref:Uncharacterized protein n=1 Tax=Eumeta variegata TaxID=151549 RepID=A0A4C1WKE0_EUMVA|nr:hypothetical protein EVAR_96262_1 [Eumeta japonica]